MNTIFLLISFFVYYARPDTTEILLNITKAVFKDEKTLCYIHDSNSLEYIVNQALLFSHKVVLNYEIDHLRNVTRDVFCNGYILCIDDLIKFEDYFENKNKYSFYFKPHRRILLIFEKRSKVTPVLQFMTNLYGLDIITVDNLKPNEIVYGTKSNSKVKNMVVYSVYKNKVLLDWNYKDPLVFDGSKFEPYKWFPKFYSDNKHFVFKISLFDCPPFVRFTENGKAEGTEFRLIETVVKNWPVKYNVPQGEYKDMWSIIWKQMEANLSDLASCSMWQTASEKKIVDFTYPFRQTCVTFLVPKPQLLPDSTFVFQPFQYILWFVIAFVVFLVSIGLFLFRTHHENTSSYADLFQEISLQLLRLISGGSIRNFPSLKVSSVRFYVISWIFVSLMISAYYQAGLTSNLTKPRYTNLINTLNDMVEKKVIWLSPTDYFQRHFKSSGSATFVKLADLYQYGYIKNLDKNKALVVKTLENIYVCDIQKLCQEKRKPLKVLGECFGKYYFGFVMQKNSPFTKIFNDYSFLFAEHDLLKYWYRVSTKEVKAQEILFQTYLHEKQALIELSKLKGNFYFLVLAHFVSILVFILEVVFHKYFY